MKRNNRLKYFASEYYPVVIITALLFIITLMFARDFGITYDEHTVLDWGRILFNHFSPHSLEIDTRLLQTQVKDYGNFYGMTLYAVGLILTGGFSFIAAHIVNMLFSVLAFISAYLLLYKQYQSKFAGTLGVVSLLLIPRFIGHIPSNLKDIPFAIIFLVGIALIYFYDQIPNKYLRSIALGAVISFAIQLRVLGITLGIAFIAYQILLAEKLNKKKLLSIANETMKVSVSGLFCLMIFWPLIGFNLPYGIYNMLTVSTDFPWVGTILTGGKLLDSLNLPITYLPEWFLATTPIVILFFFALQLCFIKQLRRNKLYLLTSGILLLNLFLYLILRPVLYDGLRHYLFLLPLIGIISAMSAIEFFKYIKESKSLPKMLALSIPVAILSTLSILFVAYNYVTLHPYQYVFFNEIIGGIGGAEGEYELDYWGASNQEGVSWMKDKGTVQSSDNVFFCGNPDVARVLNGNEFNIVNDVTKADYLHCYTRSTEMESQLSKLDDSNIKYNLVYSVQKQGVNLLEIYKIE